MAKRALMDELNAEREAILAKIEDLNTSVSNYFKKFEKTTIGQQSMGEASYKYADKCLSSMALFPEILPPSFPKEDFSEKMIGVTDFFDFRKRILEIVGSWDGNSKICKSDSMFYSNKYYNIIKVEANSAVKYKPTFDDLTIFFKKSASEKSTEAKKPKGDSEKASE